MHDPLPHLGEGLLQKRVASGNHNHAIWLECRCDFTFGSCNRFTTTQATDVGGADIGDHCDIRLGTARQPRNLARTTHAHLHHHGCMVAMGTQQGQRNADVVVVIAGAGLHRTQ